MAIQTTELESELDSLEQKAEEYDTRTNTEDRVVQTKNGLQRLNRELNELKKSLDDFERQTRILTEIFGRSLPPKAANSREEVRSIARVSQDDLLDIIDDSTQSLSRHIDDVRETQEEVDDAVRFVNKHLQEIRRQQLDNADTAESIQKIVGEDPDAIKTISRYRSFFRSILSPKDSVSQLNSRWQELESDFENLDTDWEGFQKRHGLSEQTIEDLKTLSHEGQVDLDELSDASVNEMLDVPELRSTIKVSL